MLSAASTARHHRPVLWAWQDADERAKLSHAALTGITSNNPLESDIPDLDVQTSPLTFVVASDFVRRITVWGKQTDFLIWMQFPGRWNVCGWYHLRGRGNVFGWYHLRGV